MLFRSGYAPGSTVNLNLGLSSGAKADFYRNSKGYFGAKIGLILTYENPDTNGNYILTNDGIGKIEFNGDKSIGIQIFAQSYGLNTGPKVTVNNKGIISIAGAESYGIKISSHVDIANSSILNDGVINVEGYKEDPLNLSIHNDGLSSGMAIIEDAGQTANPIVAGSIMKNNSIINVSGQGNSGMFLKTAALGDNITNATTNSQINISGTRNIGMRMDMGTLVLTGSPTGENLGTISIASGSDNIGMLANGKNGIGSVQAINSGYINIIGGNKNNAMSSINGGNIKNNSKINIASTATNSIGVYVENGSTGTGTGDITIDGNGNAGVANFGTFNQTGGTIDVSGKDSIGIYAKDSSSSTTITGSTVNAKNGAVAFYADGSSGSHF